MIEAQLERLSAEEQRVLELASIAGASFSRPSSTRWRMSMRRRSKTCARSVSPAPDREMGGTHRFPDGTISERYEFVHALYRQVLYDRLAPRRTARLHRRIGERLEALHPQPMDEVVPELAYHFEAAADWPRAVEYLQLEADIARRRFADPQADSLLQRALELVSNLPEAQRAPKELELLAKLAPNRAAVVDVRGAHSIPHAVRKRSSVAPTYG